MPPPAQQPMPLYIIDSAGSSPVLATSPLPVDTPTPLTPSPTPTPLTPSPSHAAYSASPRSSASPPAYTRGPSRPRHPVYAVRVGREGEVFSSSREAWARCLSLQREGKSAVLVVAASIARALLWIECAPLDDEHDDMFRRVIQDALDVYRAEQTDSSSEDSMDSSLRDDDEQSTDGLVAELQAREARDSWRRVS